ncbi:MAG TPA: DUF1844 domain-containing protein [Candidatus Binataceae bacterium]|nr:DUF1844 domain-containing protein [Candidatus Binataceae bacterium]
MDAEEEKPKAFKVEDRRRFSAEGDLKPEGELKAERRAETPQTDRSSSAAADRPPPPPSSNTATGDAGTGFTAVNPRTDAAAPIGEMTFATFMVGLSTQALVHLGEMPDPNSGQPADDMFAAQQLIDLIAMLQEKTRGNLDDGETQLVQSILFELRMKYVERARQGPH